MFFACALLILACSGIDVVIATHSVVQPIALRVLWSGVVIGIWWVYPRATEQRRRLLHLVLAGTGPAFLIAIAASAAPLPNPLFYWVLTFPTVATVVVRDDVRAVALTAVMSVVLPVGAFAGLGRPWPELLMWATLFGCAGALGIVGSVAFKRILAAERQVEAERIAALERLAESERRRSEAERLAFVGQLAAGVAHEINNPLAYSLSNTRFLREHVQKLAPMAAGEVLDETLVGLERISQIVADLKTMARVDAPTLSEFPVEEVVAEAVRLASVRLRSVGAVEQAIPEKLPLVRADRRRLSQVLVNLLVNAADALEEHRSLRPPVIAIRVRRDGAQLAISVCDNGPGISDALKAKIFDPFFTTKPAGKGTGLGLSLSRDYVAIMGGTLELTDAPGGGACFSLRLPHEEGAEDPAAAQAA